MLGYQAKSPAIVRGRSGAYHEVDIVAESGEDVLERLLVVKAKDYHEDPFLRLDEVLGFWAQVEDVGADRGIIVTTCGMEKSTIEFASYYGIRIIEGRDFEELRWKAVKQQTDRALRDLGESPAPGS